jgi:serine/threonine protein kinase
VRKQGTKYVLKVFKKGTFLRHLQYQWPQGMLQFYAEKFETRDSGTVKFGPRYICDVVRATLLRDGQFAFLMVREKGDLRSVIDNIMLRKAGQDSGPFVTGVARRIMYQVAKGMDSLHNRDIIHRDLKASNVLVTMDSNYIVADFESSIGVVGTGFFRAPEILQACKDGNVNQRLELFTKEVDIYGYGMTCYEILTGKLPFGDHSSIDYDVVLKGLRPKILEYVDGWAPAM